MNRISFNYFMLLQARFLCFAARRDHINIIEAAQIYAAALRHKLEQKYNITLIKKGSIIKTRQLEKPFKKGDIIQAEIISSGRYNDESLAIAQNRVITMKCQFTKRKKKKVRITKDMYNVFYGIPP